MLFYKIFIYFIGFVIFFDDFKSWVEFYIFDDIINFWGVDFCVMIVLEVKKFEYFFGFWNE